MKLRGAVVLATLHRLHDSGSKGVDAKKAANISLVSNLTCKFQEKISWSKIHIWKRKRKSKAE
jgi:hypothetical protein